MFENLVHLVGFIIRIYHEARSPERLILYTYIYTNVIRGRPLSGFVLIELFMNNDAAHILRILFPTYWTVYFLDKHFAVYIILF